MEGNNHFKYIAAGLALLGGIVLAARWYKDYRIKSLKVIKVDTKSKLEPLLKLIAVLDWIKDEVLIRNLMQLAK